MPAVILSPQLIASCSYKTGVTRSTLRKHGYDFLVRVFSSAVFNCMIRNAHLSKITSSLSVFFSKYIDRISAKFFNEANKNMFLSFPIARYNMRVRRANREKEKIFIMTDEPQKDENIIKIDLVGAREKTAS